ncbi:EVE domain-containing protein [Paenibacillus oralis]|uniref:EVE domain-containing protein n=1 Tax=Paenibacillus oralis TaxID=2490856 RepID=A0A3P3U0V4_9BACL|nr:EVE domain-containing protein [Paenibacillus oralis]RRJ63972.1 EVE domain-containing protein [Paenibacillus oralis]
MTDGSLQEVVHNAKQAWVFQWNPEDYDVFADFHSGKQTESWRVNAHWGQMQPGDAVLLWKSSGGEGNSKGEAGIYAVGVLKQEPYQAPPEDVCKYRVNVEYISLLSAPILKSGMTQDPLKQLAARIVRGSNFKVEDDEWKTLITMLLSQTSPAYWLFNVSADKYPEVWRNSLEYGVAAAQYEVGKQDRASVKRNCTLMQSIRYNDYIVAYSGNKSIVAVGQVSRTFFEETAPEFLMNIDGEPWGQRIGVNWFLVKEPGKIIQSNFKKFVGVPQDSVMGSYVCFQMDAEGFYNVWNFLNEEIPENAKGGKAKRMFQPFIENMRSKGFAFGDELINTYITSLRSKPFVLLSGISGTGKTKLAQLFAQYMSPPEFVEIETSPNDNQSYDNRVQESYHKFNRITIKKQYEDLLDLPLPGQSVEVNVFVDEVQEVCKVYRNRNSGHGAVQLFLRGAVAKTLKERYPIGEWIRISFEADEHGDIIRLGKPAAHGQHCLEKKRHAFLSVRPDWVDNKSLLGYYNPITEEYQATELLFLLLKARKDREKPYFVIFDEMNLAKVEYYFSDFLSCLESRRVSGKTIRSEHLRLHDQPPIPIEDENGVEYEIPPTLEIPENVYFTGTVNIDETTYMFSPKVLDRANVIEINEIDLEGYRATFDVIDQNERYADSEVINTFTDKGRYHERLIKKSWEWTPDLEKAFQSITKLHRILQSHRLPFGYRVVDEILFFLANAAELGCMEMMDALDLQIMQRILPKLHGNRARLQQPLMDLLVYFCGIDNGRTGQKTALSDADRGFLHAFSEGKDTKAHEANSQFKTDGISFHRSAKKLYAMIVRLEQYGFVSFIE